MAQSLAISSVLRKNQTVGGWASYLQNLLRGIEQVAAGDDQFRDLDVTVFHGSTGVLYTSDRFEYRELSDRMGRFAAESRLGLVDSLDFDATLFPNYFRPPVVRSRRTATVIHDLNYLNLPEFSSFRNRIWLRNAQRYALCNSDAIVTISAAVKQDVLRWFGDRWESKIHPIWNPIAFERLDGDGQSSVGLDRPYVLGVAVDRPFKNLHVLIKSYNQLRNRFPDLMLVLVGELRSRRPKGKIHAKSISSSMPPTVDLVRELGLQQHVKITGFVSDDELGAYYRGADAFVLPSQFEGFGMPAVEALAMGVPAIVSDIPVMREVTLGKARYIADPSNSHELADGIADVLRDRATARPTQETVEEIRRLFAPATIAKQYLEVLFGA